MRSDLAQLEGKRFDVIVIGGGINGASTAQHLAAAGYQTLIVDKSDFGAGASSRSTRLLHCGLRYLAPERSLLDFVRHPSRFVTALRMARLAMQARAEFVATSPERTQPFTLHFPIYRDGAYRGWQIDAAFALLRGFGGGEVPLDYRRLGPEEIRAHALVGGLRDLDRLGSVAAFREFQFNWPERVGLDAVLDAERLGASARNHTAARLLARKADGGWTVELTDALEAQAPARVEAAVVLVMSGVWIDGVLQRANRQATRKVFGTKGCHILVQLPAACAGAGIATFNSQGSPLYCIPWKGLHYFGPTESPYDGDPNQVFVTVEEADGLLAEANWLLPGLRLTRADIRMSWAGVRPLTYDPGVPFGNRSRVVHDLAADGLPGVFALTGGPVMTHRSAGRDMTQLVAARLPPSRTPGVPIYAPPADGIEHAATLSDVMFRRRGVAWSGPIAAQDLSAVAAELGAALGWDNARIAEETARFEAEWNDLYAPPHQRRRPDTLVAAAE